MSRYYNDFSDTDTGDDLEHYGVLGMKWGVRKKTYSPVNPFTHPAKNTAQNVHNMHQVVKGYNQKVSAGKKITKQAVRTGEKKVVKGAVDTAKAAREFKGKSNAAKREQAKYIANEFKQIHSNPIMQKGRSEVHRHLTLTGRLKPKALQEDTKRLGEQFVKLKGRNAA